MSLIYFILCAYGLTQILTSALVFDKIRPRHKFFHCSMCMGFWVGIFLLVISNDTELFNFERSLINAFLLGCVSSGTSYILERLFGDKGLRVEK